MPLTRFVYLLLAAYAFNCFAESKPNIILFYTDDQGWGDIQIYNPERGKIKTPWADKLAMEGIMFTDAHSTTGVCTPSRYSILSGRYNWRTIKKWGILRDGYQDCMITPDRPSIANLLQDAGYYTGAVGKWHIGYWYDFPEGYTEPKSRLDNKKYPRQDPKTIQKPIGSKVIDGPLDKGFDYFYGIPHGYPNRPIIEQDEVTGELDPVLTLQRNEEKSIEFIQRAVQEKQQPFFLYMAVNSPHVPIDPRPEWVGKSGLNNYADFVMETDHVLGRVMQTLDDLGVADDTIVIFTSDNGASKTSGFGPLQRAGHYPSGPFRGKKSDLWEGGHRVPFIVRWPNSPITPGSVSDELISQTDLFATFAEIIDKPIPEKGGVDSVSFFPALKGEPIESTRAGIAYHSIKGYFAYQMDQWKIILHWNSGDQRQSERPEGEPKAQLYDLENDPGETTNLYETHPEIFERVLAQLESDAKRGRSTDGPPDSNDLDTIDLWKWNK